MFKKRAAGVTLWFWCFSQICINAPVPPVYAGPDSPRPSQAFSPRLEDSVISLSHFAPGKAEASVFSLISDPEQKLVIYIQDAHGNLSAQKNIAEILRRLSLHAGLKEPWIALEGTRFGEIDHRLLSNFPRPRAKKLVTEYLLQRGKLNGADYYAALVNPRARLFGVDSGELARKNRQSYRDYLHVKEEAEAILTKLRRINQILKKRIYDADLVRLEETLEGLSKEGRFFLKRVHVLLDLAARYGIPQQDYQFLNAWKNEMEFPREFKADFLLARIKKLGKRLWRKCLSYREARDAFDIDRTVKFYEKLLNFSLMPEEYTQYLKAPASFRLERLREKIQNYTFILLPHRLRFKKTELAALEEASKAAFEFYRLARRRDGILTRHLATLSRKNPAAKIFFISGGFHSERILRRLRERKTPFVLVTPRITGREGEGNYWRLLAGDSPLLDSPPPSLSPSSVALENRLASLQGRTEIRRLLALASRTGRLDVRPSGEPSSRRRSEARTSTTFHIDKADPATLAQMLTDAILDAAKSKEIQFDRDYLKSALWAIFSELQKGAPGSRSSRQHSQSNRSGIFQRLSGYDVSVALDENPSGIPVAIRMEGKTALLTIQTSFLDTITANEENMGNGIAETFLSIPVALQLLFPPTSIETKTGKRSIPAQESLLMSFVVAVTERLKEAGVTDQFGLTRILESPLIGFDPASLDFINELLKRIPLDPGILAREAAINEKGFRVLGFLDSGTFGKVYLAERGPRLVAIKILDPNQAVQRRVQTEVDALLEMKQLEEVFRDGEDQPIWGIAMTYHKGENLLKYCDRNPPPIDFWDWRERTSTILDFFRQIAESLKIAHKHDFVHRDLKLANIIIDEDGIAHLVDFGLAKYGAESPAADKDDRTATGMIVGTPATMAPEQVDDKRDAMGPWTDFYGLTAALFEAIFNFNFQDTEGAGNLSRSNLFSNARDPDHLLFKNRKITSAAPPELLIGLIRIFQKGLAVPLANAPESYRLHVEKPFTDRVEAYIASHPNLNLTDDFMEYAGEKIRYKTRYQNADDLLQDLIEFNLRLKKWQISPEPRALSDPKSPGARNLQRPPGYETTADLAPSTIKQSRRHFVWFAAGGVLAGALLLFLAYLFGPTAAAKIRDWFSTLADEKEPLLPKETPVPSSTAIWTWSGKGLDEGYIIVGTVGHSTEGSPILRRVSGEDEENVRRGQVKVVVKDEKKLLSVQGTYTAPATVMISEEKGKEVSVSGSVWHEGKGEAFVGFHNEEGESTTAILIPTTRFVKIPTHFFNLGGAVTRKEISEAISKPENTIFPKGRPRPAPTGLIHYKIEQIPGTLEAWVTLWAEGKTEKEPFFREKIPLKPGKNVIWFQVHSDPAKGPFISMDEIRGVPAPKSEARHTLPATGPPALTPVLFLPWGGILRKRWSEMFRPGSVYTSPHSPRIVFIASRAESRDIPPYLAHIYGIRSVEGDPGLFAKGGDYALLLARRAAAELGVDHRGILPIALDESFPKGPLSKKGAGDAARVVRLQTDMQRFISEDHYRSSRFLLAELLARRLGEIENWLVYNGESNSWSVPVSTEDRLDTLVRRHETLLLQYQSA